MTHQEFNEAITHIRDKSLDTLIAKNSNYSSGEDALHNFTAGAEIIGGTPAQAAWAYMTKHLVSLRDKVQRNDFADLADLEEKCQDIINYTAIIYAVGVDCVNEERKQRQVMSYRDAVLKRNPDAALEADYDGSRGGVIGCPGSYLIGAPVGDKMQGCQGVYCSECWGQAYRSEEWR